MKAPHSYRCASCGMTFGSVVRAGRCPACGGKVLIHIEGESRKSRGSCSRPSCAGCAGCSIR